MPTPPTPTNRYYPRLSSVVSENDIPDILGFIKTGVVNLLDRIYFQDLQYSKSPKGDAAFYGLSIVSPKRLDIEIPGTGIFLVLNPDISGGNANISSFPITIEYQWKILAYLRFFSVGNFSFDPAQIFEVALRILNISEEQAIAHFVNTFVEPANQNITPLHQFVTDINNAQILNTPLNLPTSATTIPELVAEMFDKSGGKYASLLAFTAYLLTSNTQDTANKVKAYFRALIPQDVDEFIKEVVLPKFRATLLLSAGIEFPRNILKPVYPYGTYDNATPPKDISLEEIPENTSPYPNKVMLTFAEALFYADTEKGFGYNLDLILNLNQPAMVGNTGLIVDIHNLKIDISKTENIAEADADGRPKEFMGVYMEYTEVFLPKKWFKKQGGQTIGISANHLLVGTGGLSGNIAIRATYATQMQNGQPVVTNYFEDYFDLNYTEGIFAYSMESPDVVMQIDNHSELLTFINGLPNINLFKLKFPLTLTTVAGEAKEFKNESDYFNFIQSFPIDMFDFNQYLKFKLGQNENRQWDLGFKRFDIDFHQGQVVHSSLQAALKVTKFKKINPQTGNPEILYIDLYGEWESKENFKLSATFLPDGLTMNLFDVLDFTLQNATIGKENDNFYIEADTKIFFTTPSGQQLMGNQPIDLPAIRIYANGKFEIAGGNASIPVNMNLNLGPVAMGVTAIHFGSIQRVHDGRMRTYNYIGFDGGISINPGGIDVRGEGIKFYYTSDNDELAINDGHNSEDDNFHTIVDSYGHSYFHISTIEIDIVVPGKATPKEAIAIIKGSLTIPEPGVSDEYKGRVSINLPKANIYGEAQMAYSPKYPAWYVQAFVKLPKPIPLGPLGITGFGGLVANRYVAEKEAIGMNYNDTWYDYYVAPQRGINLDKFSGPEKTKNYSNAFSVGIGASIAPITGDRIASLRAMVLLSIPSMFAIDAGLTILSESLGLAEDDPKEPPFYAFVIVGDDSLEFGAGANFMVNKKKGSFVYIQAEVQMGFFFKNQKPWYINFGTKNKPIQVLLLKDTLPIKASGYLMISASGIEAGARVEFTFKLLILKVWAIIEVGGHISFERPQVGGYVYIEGGAKINLGIVEASVFISVFLRVELVKPFLIFAELVFKLKIRIVWFFTLKITLKIPLKWEKNKEVDTSPVAPITYQDESSTLYPEITKEERVTDMVKGVHMLTNEEFALKFFKEKMTDSSFVVQPDDIDVYIPLDTYIDVTAEKGLIPSATTDQKIGGHTTAASNFLDLIPPKKVVPGGHTLRQVKHQYSIEDVEIKFHNGSSWVDYHPYKAIEPLQSVDHLKVGFWQLNSKQYDGFRILGTTPFSFMDGGQPGWFIPEQYGITASTLFCAQTHEVWHHSDVLNKPLGTLYYPPSQYPSNTLINGAYYQLMRDWFGVYGQGYNGTMILSQGIAAMEVTNTNNNFGFAQSLSFSNNIMVITLTDESAKVNLKLSTLAQGVTIKYYKSIFGTGIYQNYALITEVYRTQAQLATEVQYASPDQFVSKIEIIPDGVDQNAIDAINAQIDQIWATATANTSGNTVVYLTPQQQDEHDALIDELHTLLANSCNNQQCSKDEILCTFLEDLINNLNGCIRYVRIKDLFWDNWNCFLHVIQMIEDFNNNYPEYLLLSLLESYITDLEQYPSVAKPPLLSGALQLAQNIFDQISIIGNCDCQNNNIVSCKTSIQEVRWMTVLDYQTQQLIPGQPALNANFQQMVAGVKEHIQPIWKPNTAYCIHVHMKDTVNDGQSAPGEWEYIFGFKTKGPLGHFDKQTAYIEGGTKPEEYPITMLKSYIDMRRSYPNADGSLLGAKPLFYGHNQCKLQVFFTKPYVYHMFKTWETYQGQDGIKGSINIAIKDPIAQNQDIIPYPLPQSWTPNPPTTVPLPNSSPTWVSDADPNLPLSIQVLNSFIRANNLPCGIDLGVPILPMAYSYSVILTNLKPSKLYTALIYNAFDDDGVNEYAPQLQGNLINYEENQKVHEYVFKTSRYADFEEQVKSYMLKEYDDDGNLIEERDAIYTIQTKISQQQIDDTYKTVNGANTSTMLENISNTYSDPFDRVYEGVLGLKPLDPPNFTEFIRVVNQTNEFIALIIRNPEPFNDPKIPKDIIQDSIIVLGAANYPDLAYDYLYSKDYSQVMIMHQSKKIVAPTMNFEFKYKLWNGSSYDTVQTVVINNIHVND